MKPYKPTGKLDPSSPEPTHILFLLTAFAALCYLCFSGWIDSWR